MHTALLLAAGATLLAVAPPQSQGVTRGDAVPGQLIVTYTAEVPHCVHCLVRDGHVLDDAHAKCGVKSATPLFRSLRDEAELGKAGPVTAKALRELHQRRHEELRARYPVRAARAASTSLAPDTSQTYLLEVSPGLDPHEAAALLRQSPYVRSVEPNLVLHRDAAPNDPLFTQQWSHRVTRAEQGWSLQTDASGAVIAVVGEGIAAHPDLIDNLWVNAGEVPGNGLDDDGDGFIDDVNGWDFRDDDGDPRPTAPHETGVAGVIAARGNNSTGLAGVAWSAKLMSLRIAYTQANAISALDYAVARGADVVNMSFSNTDPNKYGAAAMRQAVEAAVAQGVLLVSSAGNENTGVAPWPAAFDEVLSVGSTDVNDRRAASSNFGRWVDVAAPGQSVLTTWLDVYQSQSGTSFSAPYVAGLAGLLLTREPALTLDELRIRLEYGSDVLTTDQPVGRRVNVHKALTMTAHPLIANIESLADEQLVGLSAPLAIRGTSLGGTYRLEVRPAGQVAWSVVGAGFELLHGTLGTLDPAALPPGTVRFELRLTTSMPSSTTTVATLLNLRLADTSGVPPGWPVIVGSGFATGITAAPIDGRQLLFFGQRDAVWALGADGRALAGWPARLDATVMSTPAVGDVTGDGVPEVVVSATLGDPTKPLIYAFGLDGQLIAGWPVGTDEGRGGVLLANVDADPALEVVGSNVEGQAFALNGDGTSLPGWPRLLGSTNVQGPPAVGDLDGDGRLELVFHSWTMTVVLRPDGTEMRRWGKRGTGHTLILFDAEDDGRLEIAEATTAGLTVRSATGQILFSTASGEVTELAAADVGPPGGVELVGVRSQRVSGGDSDVFVWSVTARRTLDGWPRQVGSDAAAPTLADLDGDCRPEIIVPSDSLVSAFHLDGSMVNLFPKLSSSGAYPSAATAVDLDGDGVLDLVGASTTTVGGTLIHRWVVPGATQTGAAPWPMLRVDAHNSGLGPAAVRCTKTQAPGGAWCKGDSECASGSCSEGVCCATACTGSCFGCAEPGAEGVCTVRQSKLETDASCPDRQCTVARSCTSGTSCGRV
ncbi:MAG: S8 family serine peptidase, partial [Myxococcaceae bacterium]|nr:S8 family serine peptidase [Myxococcaceae bacterium]